MAKIEKCLIDCDISGATYEELKKEACCTTARIKEIIAYSSHVIEINGRFYHNEAFIDLEEGADALRHIIDKLLKRNNGTTTAVYLCFCSS